MPDVLRDLSTDPMLLGIGLASLVATLMLFALAAGGGGAPARARGAYMMLALLCSAPVSAQFVSTWALQHFYHQAVPALARPLLTLSGTHVVQLALCAGVALNVILTAGWFGLGRRSGT